MLDPNSACIANTNEPNCDVYDGNFCTSCKSNNTLYTND